MSEPTNRPPEPTRRVPRAEVRRRLLTAAAAEFTARGYDDARLESIAHAAGLTKGAIYSNFGGKRELFAAILTERADLEREEVMGHVDGAEDLASATGLAARSVARRIIEDSERGKLGLEFAARATRDEDVRSVLAPMRRAQRAAAADSVAGVAERAGAPLAVEAELAGLILHCLTNGLSMEHLADPDSVDASAVEQAFNAVLTWLTGHAPGG